MTNNSQNFYITSQSQLHDAISLIREAKIFAIDTEFTRETTYYPILSIIQIAVKNSQKKKESFIIDCLVGLDLSEFFAVISDPKITKILHSSAQDLQIFYHKSKQLPQGVIDTQVMANFCGLGFSVGYSNLVEKLFSQTLDKKEQRSDWQRRPLNQKQIEYALLDVLFLEEIYDQFYEDLVRQNRLEWCLEEMKLFIEKNLLKSEENLGKSFSFRGKDQNQISQIKNFILWREGWAKKVNVPRQHFLRDDEIDRIVTNQNCDLNFDAEVTAEIQKILDDKEEVFENLGVKQKKFFMNEKQKNCYEEAKKLISKISTKENFREQFLLTSDNLKKIICEQNLFNEKVFGWRYQLFGKELQELIQGNN